MIKIVGPKKNERKEEESKNTNDSKKPENNPAYLRLTKDLQGIDIPANAVMNFPNKEDITNFDVTVKPEEGSYWYGGTYSFSVSVPNGYPHDAPKITCNTKVFWIIGGNRTRYITPTSTSTEMSVLTFWDKIGSLSWTSIMLFWDFSSCLS